MRRAAALALLAMSAAAQVRYEDIQKGPDQNWLTYSGDFSSQRYSSLSQINRK